MSREYSKQQVEEALAFWQGELAKLRPLKTCNENTDTTELKGEDCDETEATGTGKATSEGTDNTAIVDSKRDSDTGDDLKAEETEKTLDESIQMTEEDFMAPVCDSRV